MIYAVARDNEFEHLADVIAADPAALLLLAERSLAQPEPDARWQFAARLGTWVVRRGPAEALLLRLVDDPDEYVRRRALLSLGKMRSLHAEALAVRAWDTGEEYQRIAALWVLKDIASDKLATYVARAHEDGREHVVWNAEQVLLPAEEPGPD